MHALAVSTEENTATGASEAGSGPGAPYPCLRDFDAERRLGIDPEFGPVKPGTRNAEYWTAQTVSGPVNGALADGQSAVPTPHERTQP